MADYMLRRYHARRTEIIDRLGGECASCAANDNLEIDHADASRKSFDIARLWSISRDRLDAELAKCQLLCQPCHAKKSVIDRGKSQAKGCHGTLSAARYCKCDECRAAKAEYMQQWRARRRG